MYHTILLFISFLCLNPNSGGKLEAWGTPGTTMLMLIISRGHLLEALEIVFNPWSAADSIMQRKYTVYILGACKQKRHLPVLRFCHSVKEKHLTLAGQPQKPFFFNAKLEEWYYYVSLTALIGFLQCCDQSPTNLLC